MECRNRNELVYETLKREMLDLKLEPGRMLSENEICERFGVSRLPCGRPCVCCRSRDLWRMCPIRESA